MTLEDEFRDLVNGHLASLADLFDAELQAILNDTQPKSATVIFFEYDSPHFAEDFAVMMHFLSGECEAEHSVKVLGGTTVVPESAYEDERYECIEPWRLASDILECWLVDRWEKHSKYPLSAYAGHHDSSYCTRLADGKELQWDSVSF